MKGTHQDGHGLNPVEDTDTQLEEAQARAYELAAMAHAAHVSKNQFLANISHEIRTPLNGIIGMAELTLETDLTAQQYEYLSLLRGCSQALLTLINDLLDFSKLDTGRLKLERVEFDPREVIEEATQLLAIKAHDKGLSLLCDIGCELPSVVLGDADRFRQILLNLIGNAIKFTEQGYIQVGVNQMPENGVGPKPQEDSRIVRLQAEPLESTPAPMEEHEGELALHISVRDTGIGIAEDKQESIFDAFTQADGSISREYGGAGLGLTICRELLRAMNGSIWVESEPGHGSTFHITARFAQPREIQDRANVFSPLAIKGSRILILDQHEQNLMLVAAYLNRWNLKPETATTVADAIEKIRDSNTRGRPYSLVIAYAHMPDMEPEALTETIQSNIGGACPLLVMLPPVEPDATRRQLIEQHVAGTITMPIVPSRLLSAVIRTIHPRPTEKDETKAGTTRPEGPAPLKILVAEDNEVNLKLAIYTLESMGQHVITATNGTDAVERFQSEAPDAILMDIQMPVLNGMEATRKIRALEEEKGGHIPIAALTAHAMQSDKARCMRIGMDAYITKPVARSDLQAFLEHVRTKKPMSALGAAPEGRQEDGMVFNAKELLERLGGDTCFLHDLVHIFLQHTPGHIDKLQQLLDGNNMKDAQRMAHTIKGGGANISAHMFRDYALQMEKLCAEQKQEEALRLMPALNEAYAQLCQKLETSLTELNQ
ncbi:MAG: sensor histidine kinase [Spartobacteria bacterium]|nr:sensor histidine kinase [Spartobacteria bacterium]